MTPSCIYGCEEHADGWHHPEPDEIGRFQREAEWKRPPTDRHHDVSMVEYWIRHHACRPPFLGGPEERWMCDCGRTILLACPKCGDVLFSVNRKKDPCAHGLPYHEPGEALRRDIIRKIT